jgi:hypothetical protein
MRWPTRFDLAFVFLGVTLALVIGIGAPLALMR